MFETIGVGRGGIISLGESRIGRGLGIGSWEKQCLRCWQRETFFPGEHPERWEDNWESLCHELKEGEVRHEEEQHGCWI